MQFDRVKYTSDMKMLSARGISGAQRPLV